MDNRDKWIIPWMGDFLFPLAIFGDSVKISKFGYPEFTN